MNNNMNEQHCGHFLLYPMGLRLLYTSTLIVLGVGYMFAMIYVYTSHAGRDGDPALSVEDLIIAYSGTSGGTVLESAIKGPMSRMLSKEQGTEILTWITQGADEAGYEQTVAPIFEKRCVSCHSGKNPHIPDLRGYAHVMETVSMDEGMEIFTLIRVSHIHLFGLTFIFFVVSYIFVHAYMRQLWLKRAVIVIPFLSILLDIASWYLTKAFSGFAWVVLISGLFMGLSFAIQWVVSIYQMWFYKMPDELVKNGGKVC